MQSGKFTMGAVAQHASVSRQALYLHFDGLNDLAIEAARYTDQKFDIQRELEPARRATDADALLHEMAAFFGRYNPKIAPIVRAAQRLAHTSPESRAGLEDRRQARLAGTRQILDRLDAWGALREGLDTAEVAVWLVGLGSVALWYELVVEGGWQTEQYVTHIEEAMRAALLQRQP